MATKLIHALCFLVVVLLIGAGLVKRGHLTAHPHKQGNPPTDQT